MNKHSVIGCSLVLSLLVISAQVAHAAPLPFFPILPPPPAPEIPHAPTPLPPVIQHPLTLPSSISVSGTSFRDTLIAALIAALHLDCANETAPIVTPTPPVATTPPLTITYTTNRFNNWQISAGFNHGNQWFSYVTPTNAQGAGNGADPFDTGQPATAPIEVLLADTNGKDINDTCGRMTYTGNPTTDLACYINEAKAQGYTYVIGQHAALTN